MSLDQVHGSERKIIPFPAKEFRSNQVIGQSSEPG